MDLIVLSIPIFFLLIGIELFYQFKTKKQLYRLNDMISNINCGIAQQTTNIFSKSLLFISYYWVYHHLRIFTIKETWYSLIFLLLAIDFLYYFFHRYAHEIAVFWGSHAVHHQSEDYNFSVALRQSSLQTFVSAWFYLPLAFLGFSFSSFITVAAIQTLYQFWIHTEMIYKLPTFFEFIFNTPSHHRVHHSSDPKYIDKNHGGTFIIWDRLFGTFKEEEDPIHYGVTKPVNSWNVLWINFEYYKWLGALVLQARGWDKLRVLYKKTGWRPEYLGGPLLPEERLPEYQKYDVQALGWMKIYTTILFVLMLGAVAGFLSISPQLSALHNLVYILLILWIILNIGALVESKPWANWSELLRISISYACLMLLFSQSELWIKISISIISIIFFMIYLTFYYINQRYKSSILARQNSRN
ncbi:MAG: sterol desaturase family protein [Chitinophagales bacterium]|nr:sterol desaturase family protein [Chitinophagales bacterium]MCZ2393916.1 sterol desaturase family protein [Chitinophagales bacterium]